MVRSLEMVRSLGIPTFRVNTVTKLKRFNDRQSHLLLEILNAGAVFLPSWLEEIIWMQTRSSTKYSMASGPKGPVKPSSFCS